MDARTGNRQKRISRKQEAQTAADLGGRVQANSGATRFGGADVRVAGQTRVECKYTEQLSYTLKLSDLLKLKDQAARALEEPILQFQFRGRSGTPIFSFAVSPAIHGRPPYQITTSRQVNLHEMDMREWFFLSKDRGPMRIVFMDKKKKEKEWKFDIFEWDDFLARRKADAGDQHDQ